VDVMAKLFLGLKALKKHGKLRLKLENKALRKQAKMMHKMLYPNRPFSDPTK
jgi:hypothetical protein